MNVYASLEVSIIGSDTSLGKVLDALAPYDEKVLVFECEGSEVQAGYHVTEVKAGSFVTLDCGGNPDAWQETILQVEDIRPSVGKTFMKVGKFRSILAQVDKKVRLNADARLTLEVSRPDEAMRVYDVAGIDIEDDRAVVHLGERSAICKPRHRAALAETDARCSPSSAKASATACCT